MYLKTSEAFAERYKPLSKLVEFVDSLLVESADPTLVVDTISGFSGHSNEQVTSVLDHYVDAGILFPVVVVRCQGEDCDVANELENGKPPKYCSECGGSTFKRANEKLYRLAPGGRDERARVLSGLSTKEWPQDVAMYRDLVDSVIVSLKSEEFKAVIDRFGDGPTISGRRQWNMRRVWSERARRNFLVVLVRANSQGNEESYGVTRDAIDDFSPKSVMVVGIAGAVPGDLTLGDVVFGKYVHDMNLHETAADGTRRFSIKGEPLPTRAQNLLANLLVSLPPSLRDLGLPELPPLNLNAEVQGDEETATKIRMKLKQRYGDPPTAPAVPHFEDGEIASSDGLIKSVELVNQWKTMAKHILAVEMESAGACRAARDAGGKCVVIPIRAISDVIGLVRDERWTRYACEVAAAYAMAFIRSWQEAPQ